MIELLTICLLFLLPNGDVECRCYNEANPPKNQPAAVEMYEPQRPSELRLEAEPIIY
jgi:hypothetical protein